MVSIAAQYRKEKALVLPSRWAPLRYHPEQARLWQSRARFNVVPAGRRSGKTELAKRKGVLKAIGPQKYTDAWYVFAAPTHAQAKRIFWKDIKKLVPKWAIANISESELTIKLLSGAEITVLGLDKAERIEGRPIDWICIDEYGNCKKKIWDENIRPALSTVGRPGSAWLIGVPEGRNHYWITAKRAQAIGADMKAGRKNITWAKSWDYFHWISADILDPDEIESAQHELDELTFAQEYEASFLNFSGRAYYAFEREVQAAERVRYEKGRPLILTFDWNVEPGTATVLQEQAYKGKRKNVDLNVTSAIGEVWIPRNSNTRKVCGRLIDEWSFHEGLVYCYGDATGGARGSAKVKGSDWDIVKDMLKPVFGDRLRMKQGKSNPPERSRLNAMNSRLLSTDETIRFLVDPISCPHLIDDLEGTILVEGGSGEIDKDDNNLMSHLTDGVGYYIEEKFSTSSIKTSIAQH